MSTEGTGNHLELIKPVLFGDLKPNLVVQTSTLQPQKSAILRLIAPASPLHAIPAFQDHENKRTAAAQKTTPHGLGTNVDLGPIFRFTKTIFNL